MTGYVKRLGSIGVCLVCESVICCLPESHRFFYWGRVMLWVAVKRGFTVSRLRERTQKGHDRREGLVFE